MNLRPYLLTLFAVATLSAFAKTPKARAVAKKAAKAVVFPVSGKTRIRDKWGASRGGGTRLHKGIDIHARKGTPVVALASGRIVERAVMPVGGKTLWLRPEGAGWTAYYAHLDKQLVKEGQYVRKGQVIGTVGNTGNARTTPAHLHFGVRKGGHWVNPLPFVKGSSHVTASLAASKTAKKGTRKA